MATIKKTGVQLLRRFRLPKKNIDLVLVRDKFGILALYKKSKVSGSEVDSFTKVATKYAHQDYSQIIPGVTMENLGAYQRWGVRRHSNVEPDFIINRHQYNSNGDIIGKSIVRQHFKNGYCIKREISVEDESIRMTGGTLQIDKNGVSINGNSNEAFSLQFIGEKFTPMAKRVLKLFNQIVNK